MVNIGFSFNYGGEKKSFSAVGKYVIDENLTIEAQLKKYPEFDACEWVLWFENSGKTDSLIISDINDCDIFYTLKNVAPKSHINRAQVGFPCITAMHGCGGDYHFDDRESSLEFNLYDVYIEDEKSRHFENRGCRSSDKTAPFFDIHTRCEGAIIAVGWTGDWRADFTRKGDDIGIKTGLRNAKFYLKPGEKIRTSSTLIMEYGGDEDKHNKFRKLIKKHISHMTDNPQRREHILAFELWGSLPSELMVKRINELAAHDIKIEDIWIDAGWYGEGEIGPTASDPGWWGQAGNWNVNTTIHKKALLDVRDAANAGGYNLMLWIEPERAGKDTSIVKEHPEWFFLSERDEYNALLNYGNEEAREHIYNYISGHVENLGLSCYRQDFNMDPAPLFADNDEENRIGINEIKHIMGMYALWDKLLENYPKLNIDNCASGGRRFDIETLRRSCLFFRSDYQCLFNENSLVLQCHNTGSESYFPYNGCTCKTKSDDYAIRSSYAANWGVACYNTIFQEMDENDFAWLKKTVDEFRSIRRYFSCDFYNHGSADFDETAWSIWQYHDSETDSGIVMAFRRKESPFDNVTLDLKGTMAGEKYIYENLDNGNFFEGENSLKIELPQKRSCTIFKYGLA